MKRFALICLGGTLLISPALAAQPHAPGHYFDRHRTIELLLPNKRHQLIAFVCFGKGGNHYNNSKTVAVKRDGSFSYHGPAVFTGNGRTAHLTLKGRFVTSRKAVGTYTAPCARSRHFTARYTTHK